MMAKAKTVWCAIKKCPKPPVRPIVVPAGGSGGGDQMPWESLTAEQQQAFSDLLDDLDINFDGVDLDRLNGHLHTLRDLDLLDMGNYVVGTIAETNPMIIDSLDFSPLEQIAPVNPGLGLLGAAPLDDVVKQFIDDHLDVDDDTFSAGLQERLTLNLQPLINSTVVRALALRRPTG